MESHEASPARDAPIAFNGANADFRRLVTRGALLELVTFGFYRFWLTTDIRRHLWSNTEIDGDSLEYTGRGKELLLGFLIALAILLPVFFVYFSIGLAAERFKAFASAPLYAFIYLFGQFAIYRARRYRLTRTVWRGVRFWMTGSGWSYAWRAALWMALVLLTLGFAYPWQMAALERFKMRHTLYGTMPGRFEATGGQLFRRVWWIWLLGLMPPVMMFGGILAIAVTEQDGFAAIDPWAGPFAGVMSLGSVLLIALPFLHAARKAVELRWWAGGIRFGNATIQCNLRPSALIGTYWAPIGMSILVVFGFTAIGGGLAALLFSVNDSALSIGMALLGKSVLGITAYGIWYMALLLALGVLARIYLLQRVWKRVSEACTLHNADAVAEVASAGEAVSALGEGLADGLDFAGF
jgi:uncharacterized membrane protein YjgN (DUF898 family)